MSCVTCHDPHGEDRRAELERLATPAGNAVCVRCHAQYAAPAALAAHAHHDPAGAGGELHRLPHAAQEHGARLRAHPLPPHRLPDDPARVERDRPLECALCHADKTVGELVAHDGALVGAQRTIARALATLYGEPRRAPAAGDARRAARRTSRRSRWRRSARRASTAALPGVARQLVNPFPLVRYYARRALEALRGQAVRRRSRSADAGDRRGRARLRAGGLPRSAARRRRCRAKRPRADRRRRRRLNALINRAPCPPPIDRRSRRWSCSPGSWGRARPPS